MPKHTADELTPAPATQDAPTLQYVQRWTDKRTGEPRAYFRKTGEPRRALDCTPGAPPLGQQRDAILAEIAARGTPATRPGTVAGACDAYEKSADFLALDVNTQAQYRRTLRIIDRQLGALQLLDLNKAFLLDLRDGWAQRGYRMANVLMQVLKNALARPIALGDTQPALFEMIRKVKRPRDLAEPHPIWLPAEVKAALDAASPGLARAVALARFQGLRRGDVCALPESAIEGGRLKLITGKARVPIDAPVRPQLAAVLKRTGRRATRIAYDAAGVPYADVGRLDKDLAALVAVLAEAGQVRPVLTFHGLRHTFGVELALAEATVPQIMAAMGHATPHAAMIYVRQAERIGLSNRAHALVVDLTPAAGDDVEEPAANVE